MLDTFRKRLLVMVLAITVLGTGCISWRSIRPVPASVAAGRRLSRQGVAAMEQGEWASAEILFRQAISKSPDEPEPRHHLAEVLIRRGATNEALELMVAAAERAPDDAQTAVRAGQMLLAAGRVNEASTHAKRAVRLDNELASAWALRGRTFAAGGQDERAQADFACALLLDSGATDVLLDSARIYSRRAEHQRCLATLHQLLDKLPPGSESQEILMLEGRTYLALERPNRASERLALAAERGPGTADLRACQAEAEFAQGRLPEADAFARLALAVDAEHMPARQMLQQIAQRTDGVNR